MKFYIKNLINTLLSLIIIVAFYNNIANAEDVLSIGELQNIQVSQSFKESKSTIDTPAEIYTITDRDIERSGLTSIPELLRLAPGLHVAQMDSNAWSIASRGLNADVSEKIVVMIDGRKIHSVLFPAIHWQDQGLLLSDIKRIDVIRGTGANVIEYNGLSRSLWSDNALHGVINIVTKRAAETQGQYINLLHGNHESIQGAIHGGKISDDIFYRIYANNRNIDSELNNDNNNYNDDWQNSKAGFRLDWEDSISNQFVIQGGISRMQDREEYQYPSNDLSGYVTNSLRGEAESANIIAKWFHKQNNGNEFILRSYYDFHKRDFLLFKQKFNILDLDLQYLIPQKSYGKWMFGLAYRITNSDINYSPQYDFEYKENRSGLLNAIIQNKINILPNKLFLTTSLKMQYDNDLQRGQYSNLEFHPSIRSSFKITDNQSLWAGISRISRNPTIAERYGRNIRTITYGSPNIITLNGSQNFRPEELISYEFGYKNQSSKNLFFDLSFFFNQYDNIRTYERGEDTALERPYIVDNGLYGESFGFELSSKIAINDNLDISANYTFLKIDLHQKSWSNDAQTESDEYSSPQNQFSIRSYYNFLNKFSWNNMLFYVGELKKYNIKAYFRFDSNINWQINQNIKLTLAGQNLFNNRHQEFIPFLYQEASFIEPNKIYVNLNIAF